MWVTIVVSVILAYLIYKWFTSQKKSIWKELGVLEIDASAVVSNLQILLGRKSLFDADDYIYDKLGSEKFCGTIQQGNPTIIVKDLELVKRVLIKDFDHFADRRQLFNEVDGRVKDILFNMAGEKWRATRVSVTPTFTSGKIRGMMEHFNAIASDWVAELRKQAKATSDGFLVLLEPLNYVNQFTVDVIASSVFNSVGRKIAKLPTPLSVFGFTAEAVKNNDSEFMKMANRLTKTTPIQIIRFAMRFQFPEVTKVLKIKCLDMEAFSFFEDILTNQLKKRIEGELKRNDFLQLLVQAMKGELKEGEDELSTFEKDAQIRTDSIPAKKHLTEDVMIAQCIIFFFAGFTSTSHFITFVMYSLALHQDVQDKLREEVNDIVKEDGSFDYDDLGKLGYMDMVFAEVNRKVSFAGRLERLCVKEYKYPEIGLVIPKGITVAIPVKGIHHDKNYYENPDDFDPEHFSPENKAARSPYAYLPFGLGPRNCIGMRFALMESKAAVAHILHHFKIEPTENTPRPFHSTQAGFMVTTPKGLELKLTPITE